MTNCELKIIIEIEIGIFGLLLVVGFEAPRRAKLNAEYLALQLLLWEMSESMGNHDSEVVDASSVD
jgi:hypothetical protein